MAMTGESSRLRLGVVAIVVLSLFAALVARLWYLQVMNAPAYSNLAESNSTVTLPIPAPRGRLLDRNGKVLVDNKPSVVVAVDRQSLAKVKASDAVLGRLAGLLNQFERPADPFTLDSIHKTLESNRVGPYDPVPLASGISEDLHVYLVEHEEDFPAVLVQNRLLRQYHYGGRAAQLLGYVGPISDEMWQEHRDDAVPYQKDDQVGRAGVEQSFEQYLRGTPGKRVVEIDRAGRAVRTVRTVDPVAGDDVYLSIDIGAQALAEDALAQQLQTMRETLQDKGYPPAPAGAAVLLDPSNGQVLALASNPTYDPTLFVPSISTADWNALNDPARANPFTDRAVSGLYSPGSTFKLVTALAGLQAGLITPESTINDPGYWEIQNCTGGACRKTNDQGSVNGLTALPKALTVSSDVYFYRIADLFWQGRKQYGDTPIQDMAKALGLAQHTGIELPDDQIGRMPDPAWKKAYVEQTNGDPGNAVWYTGDNLNVAIGQGSVDVTPLQLAGAYGQFAVGGTRYRPTLLHKVTKAWSDEVVVEPAPEVVGKIDIQPAWQAAMTAGFEGVITNDRGTANSQFAGFPLDRFPVAGKTGTAETGADPRAFSNALFAGYGPVGAPRYVGVAVLEKSGYGATAAAPVVRQLLEAAANGGFPEVEPIVPFGPVTPTTVAPATTVTPDGTDGTGDTVAATDDPGTGTPGAPDQQPADTDPTTTGPVATGGTN